MEFVYLSAPRRRVGYVLGGRLGIFELFQRACDPRACSRLLARPCPAGMLVRQSERRDDRLFRGFSYVACWFVEANAKRSRRCRMRCVCARRFAHVLATNGRGRRIVVGNAGVGLRLLQEGAPTMQSAYRAAGSSCASKAFCEHTLCAS